MHNSPNTSNATDGDPIGPALPPHLAAKRQARLRQQLEQSEQKQEQDNHDQNSAAVLGPQRPPPPNTSSPVIGPSRPPPRPGTPPRPATELTVTTNRATADSDSSSDDDLVGPRPPSPSQLARMRDPEYLAQLHRDEALARLAQAEQSRAEAERAASERAAAGPQRGEWMLVPPSAKGPVGLPVDGSRMRSRGFNTRQADVELDRGWTETPAEKAERLAKGESLPKPNKRRLDEPKPMSQRDRQLAEAVQQYNAQNRAESLTQTYSRDESGSKKRRKDAADDPRARGFDRDRDVLGAKPISAKDRAKMVQEAKSLDSKFSHGSSAYL